MKQYLTSRYPQDKKNGGISRAWLLEQRHSAKYPNLLVEIALHPAAPALTAIRCGLSEDVLVDCLLGVDSFAIQEAQALREALHTDTGYIAYDFAFSSALSPYTETEDGNGLKEARREARRIKYKHPAIPLLKALLKEENPPHAALMVLDAYNDYQKPEYARRVQITPRMQALKVWEDYEDARELTPEGIDLLEQRAYEALRNELAQSIAAREAAQMKEVG